MAEETERQVKEETHDFKDEEQGEISNEAFESGIKEPQKQMAPKAKSSPGKRQPNDISSVDIRKHLKGQTEKLNKVTIMVQSIQKDSKSTIGQIKLIKQMQSQLKQLQNQLTQIQKFITKKDLGIKTTQLRKKTINANRPRKKR
jgi:hypothetical protein